MAPRRNPEIAVVVLQEHGDWGAGSAKLAAQVITAYVNKKRKQENNLLQATKPSAPVEVGAIWSTPDSTVGTVKGQTETKAAGQSAAVRTNLARLESGKSQVTGMQGGHFLLRTDMPSRGTEVSGPQFPDHPKGRSVESFASRASNDGFSQTPNQPKSPTRSSSEMGARMGASLPQRFRGVIN
jgi:hypothetical protein